MQTYANQYTIVDHEHMFISSLDPPFLCVWVGTWYAMFGWWYSISNTSAKRQLHRPAMFANKSFEKKKSMSHMTWHEIPPPPPPHRQSMLDPVLGYSGRARKKHLFQIRRCFLTLNILSGSLPHCLPPCLNNLWLVSLPAQMRRRTHIFRCKGRNSLKINVPPAPSYPIRRFNIITPTPEWWMRNEWHEMNQEMQGILIIVIFDL